MPIKVSDFNEKSNISVQFSYPVVDNVIYNNDTSSFFLPNNSVAPNFAYTDGVNNLYISGATIKGYISSSNIKSNPELVLEHQSSSSDKKFYVVIPLKYDTKATSSLSKLKSGSKVSLDLNKDISQKNTIYHYLSTGGVHVFVFDAPISIKQNVLSVQNISGVPTSGGEKYKITSNTKVEDEIVCGYSEETDTAASGKDKTVTTILYSVAMFFINAVIMVLCLQLMTINSVKVPLFALAGLATLVLAALTYSKKSNINLLIVYGSLSVTTAIICILSFFAVKSDSFIVKWLTPLPTTVIPSIAATPARPGPSALSKFI